MRKLFSAIISAFLLTVSSTVLAQVEAEAARLLDLALETHGGEALEQLTTYQDEGVLSSYDPAGVVASESDFRSTVDLGSRSLRLEMYAGPTLVLVQQVTPDGGFAYAVPNGEIPLSEAQVDELRTTLDSGFYGLRHGADGVDAAKYLGEQTWHGVSGHAVEVTRNGNTITYLLADDGRLLADRYDTAQLGESTNLYTEFREVDGVLVPVAYESYAFGMKVIGARLDEVRLNEPLAVDAFDVDEFRAASVEARTVSDEALSWLRANVSELAGVDAGAPNEDLRALDEVIGDARVVALGEQTHGTSEFFRMKHRVLEYLVEEHGFTLFAIEANMPEAERLNRYVLTGEGDAGELLAGLYFWTWNTQEVLAMIEWMREHNETADVPVQFTGFDMQFPGVAAEQVTDFLAELDPELLEEFEADLEEAVASGSLTEPESVPDQALIERIDALVARMAANEASYAEATSEHEAAWAVQDARVIAQALGVPRGGVVWRDEAMAQNVLWLLERNPGARMMIWAHNGHVSQAEGWMGAHLAEALADDYVAIAFSFEAGQYTAVDTAAGMVKANRAGEPQAGSVDHLLATIGPDVLLLDLQDVAGSPAATWFTEPRPFRSIGALAAPESAVFPASVVAEDFDAVIFVRTSTPSRQLAQ